ncbi:PREDICTED: peamaclein-like [Tarenaya hassleriana]|uniref:peamaclein-like n=1 Tax=Tarenaya hassleriana TaxID=28532 RepID=UPI00053C1D63|nr:PREDICTED: peamaclein-like [Tarenaya hassleriana]
MTRKAHALFLFTLLFVFFLSSTLAAAGRVGGGRGGYLDAYCGKRCNGRCAKAGFQDRCLKYCGICCRECKCVPSGTYGHKHECPCYRDKMSSKGRPKCP